MIIDALDALQGRKLLRIAGKGKRVMNNGSVNYEEIWLVGENATAHLHVNLDTDEILISAHDNDVDGEIDTLQEFVGKPFGYYWIGENSQGYKDMLLISVGGFAGGIEPQVAFLSEASSIRLKRLTNL